MTELQKTLAFAAVALVLTGAAALTVPGRSGADAAFDDQGQPFFPDFQDPAAATAMEVIDYDPDTASALPFKVMRKDGRWTIPSHHDYPADAKDRLARTAAGVIDLAKDTIRTDRVEDHEAMGVIDPLDTKSTSLKGRGKRVTLKDPSEKVLADFIIGKEVREQPDQRYVRVPGQNRVYGVNVKVDLSTRFADWIETNLLGLDASKVRSIEVDNHKVDPEAGTITPGDRLKLTRKSATDPWSAEGLGEGKELDPAKVRAVTDALADLKIVGVRPKPEGLSRDLKASSPEGFKLTGQAQRSLISKGFYPAQGRLLSNQGDVIVTTDEGVVYTLRYGEVVFAQGDELTAGSPEPEGDEAAKAAEAKKAQGAQENRYLFVTAAFSPDAVPQAEEPAEPEPADGELPADVFHRDPDDPEVVAEEKAKQEARERREADRKRALEAGEKRARELSERFAAWYYVTPGESFRKIVADRASLTKAPGSGDEGEGGPGGLPPFPTADFPPGP